MLFIVPLQLPLLISVLLHWFKFNVPVTITNTCVCYVHFIFKLNVITINAIQLIKTGLNRIIVTDLFFLLGSNLTCMLFWRMIMGTESVHSAYEIFRHTDIDNKDSNAHTHARTDTHTHTRARTLKNSCLKLNKFVFSFFEKNLPSKVSQLFPWISLRQNTSWPWNSHFV